MNWKDKRVLVTGGGGFIGSHLTERLVELGAHTVAFVHYRGDGTCGWLDRSSHRSEIEIVRGDICDRSSVAKAMRGTEIVFHLAALIAIPYSYEAPFSYLRTNIEGTVNVLEAARMLGVSRIVHTSTSEVYGTAESVPINEDHPLQAQSPYAASKVGADQMARAYHFSFNLPVVTLRPFNSFGPRQSARAVIPATITQCLRGDRVGLGNLRPTRDFNYVTDTVSGFVLAAAAAEAVGKTINIGSGREVSIRDLAAKIAELVGREIDIVAEEERIRPESSEVDRLLADNSRAREVLGWEPSVSFEDGLKHTVDWIRDNMDEFQPGTYAT